MNFLVPLSLFLPDLMIGRNFLCIVGRARPEEEKKHPTSYIDYAKAYFYYHNKDVLQDAYFVCSRDLYQGWYPVFVTEYEFEKGAGEGMNAAEAVHHILFYSCTIYIFWDDNFDD